MKQKIHDFLASFSLATIITMGPWLQQLGHKNAHLESSYIRIFVITIFFTTGVFTFLFYLLKSKGIYSKKKIIRYFSYVLLSIALIFFCRTLQKILSFDIKNYMFFLFPILILLLIIFLKRSFNINKKILFKTATIFFVIFSPLSLMILQKNSHDFFFKKTKKIVHIKNNKPKVIWIIFDAWDNHLTYIKKVKHISLPTLSKLKKSCFSATTAYQPANLTQKSIFAYLVGPKSIDKEALSQNKFKIEHTGELLYGWEKHLTLFDELSLLGVNSSVTGYHLPYARIFEKYAVKSKRSFNNEYEESTKRKIKNIYITFLDFYFFRPIQKLSFQKIKRTKKQKQRIQPHKWIREYKRIHEDANDIMTNPLLNFCFIHYSIPHPPIIFNSQKKKLTPKMRLSYSDNLVLVDQTMKEIKKNLEETKLWDSSIIIVTADHWFRPAMWMSSQFQEYCKVSNEEYKITQERPGPLVPLLIKMPYQKKGLSYSKPFNAIVLHDLVLDIYKNKIQNASDLSKWFDNIEENLRLPNLNY